MNRTITTKEKTHELLMEILGVDEVTANMILAIESGDGNGDVVEESAN